MKLAVMQPYFFPYLGYYQLAASVDHFVFLDDVSFIRRGYINRNQILLHGQPFRFSLPVIAASQNCRIDELRFKGGHSQFLQQLRHAYRRATYFEEAFSLVEAVCQRSDQNVARLCAASIEEVFKFIGRPFFSSFASSKPSQARGEARILELCERFGADTYHNASGGRGLYNANVFKEREVRLRFIGGYFPTYTQVGQGSFAPGLSMIDVLMNNSPQAVDEMLSLGELEDAK
ncbi:WbqC family protein [Stutzerimonas stutzeri]|uniref:WbqC family protein n=1 Tax=Stutzerimonas stutzeri TaxID=316 RepID=UPI00147CD7EB|nr:WbqC family protein [Stutzerimonas stutzeri]WRQ04728.1 WbqC family protein [Stutzerimonas stutzeri]